MSMESRDTAFPYTGSSGHQRGMSIRWWFAGMALQGILAAGDYKPWSSQDSSVIAKSAFDLADKMIEEGNKPVVNTN